jgi:phosphoglycerate dehydrogenase-like enzyme
MKAILQKDLFTRSKVIYENAARKHGIEFLITDVLDENSMLRLNEKGVKCFVIGAEAYSHEFYEKILEGSVIIRYGVGYDSVPVNICMKRNIKVAYTPGTLTESVTEHTFALLLAVVRKIPQLHNSLLSNEWKGTPGLELAGKTIAILGFGAIGRKVAIIAKHGFGMNVNAYDIINIKNSDPINFFSTNFREVVKDADIVSIHMASTKETIKFINRERISMMKDGAVFINTARGRLVNEEDLFMALKSGKISAAGLDVFQLEPYKPYKNADFRTLENVVMTPHCGSNTRESNDRMAQMTVMNILAYYNSPADLILIPELKE